MTSLEELPHGQVKEDGLANKARGVDRADRRKPRKDCVSIEENKDAQDHYSSSNIPPLKIPKGLSLRQHLKDFSLATLHGSAL